MPITDRQRSLWLTAALCAPAVQAASGCSWLTALVLGPLCLATAWGVRRAAPAPGLWVGTVQSLWSALMLSQILHWCALCWPEDPRGRLLGLSVLLLALWAVGKGEGCAARTCCTLMGPIVLLLGVVLASAASQMEPRRLCPVWRMEDALLIPVLLMTALPGGGGKSGGWIFLLTLAVSAVTYGVLGPTGGMEAPIYQLSRSVSLLGVVQRYESLVAAAMTMGYFAAAVWLLSGQKDLSPKLGAWPGALLCGIVYLWGWVLDSRVLALGSIAIWVVLPLAAGIFKKPEKST